MKNSALIHRTGLTVPRRSWSRMAAFAMAAVVVVGTVGLSAVPAHAADIPVIRKVDTSAFPEVQLTVLKPPVAGARDEVRVSENGRPVSAVNIRSLAEANVPVGIVLAIDTSEAMKSGDAITKVKAAAIEMVKAKAPNQKFAVVAFNGTPRPVINFTDNIQLLTEAINGLQASNDANLWGGLAMSAGLFSDQSAAGMQANVVVVSGVVDKLSVSGTFTSARSMLRGAHAVVFPVAVTQEAPVDTGRLQTLATDTGGRFISTNDPDTLTQILTGLGANISDQAVVSYTSFGDKSLDIQVTVGSGVGTAHASPGTIAEGAEVSPEVVPDGVLPGFLGGQAGLWIVGAISLVGVGLLLYGAIEIIGNDRNQLSRALRPYSDEPDKERDISKLADSEIIKKAVASTARIAHDRGLLQIVQAKLEQADLPLRPAEALFFTCVTALVAMVAGAVLKGILGLALAGLVFAYFPLFITNMLAKRRKKRFTAQLPDTLQLLAGSLRAGYSLVQGLDAVAKQSPNPMGAELQRAMSEARLGRPVEEALQEISDRMGSEDFEWAVMAIKIQREVGGNLAELLVTVGDTMVARERLRREVRGLTAEGRISAYVLCLLPVAIGAVISVMNPEYMKPLWSEFLGQVAVSVAIVMVVVGYVIMTKLIEIEA